MKKNNNTKTAPSGGVGVVVVLVVVVVGGGGRGTAATVVLCYTRGSMCCLAFIYLDAYRSYLVLFIGQSIEIVIRGLCFVVSL
jgi:hypothetical protein